jgi:hypothetical protein
MKKRIFNIVIFAALFLQGIANANELYYATYSEVSIKGTFYKEDKFSLNLFLTKDGSSFSDIALVVSGEVVVLPKEVLKAISSPRVNHIEIMQDVGIMGNFISISIPSYDNDGCSEKEYNGLWIRLKDYKFLEYKKYCDGGNY